MKMFKGALLVTGMTLSLSMNAMSAEVDQFSKRHEAIQDSESILNQRVASHLQQAIDKANAKIVAGKADACSEKVLYKEMRQFFGNHISGELIVEMNSRKTFDTQSMKVQDSIYSEWKVKNGLLLSGRLAKSGAGIGKVINIRGNLIGVDKLEHMFGRGFSYFKDHYFKGSTVKETVITGARWERFYFGGYPLFTGVFSYADLAANFNGMRFWNDILALRADPMGDVKGPYVTCEGGQFVKVKDIKLADYVDASFDETVNCSQLATKDGAEKVKRALARLGEQFPNASYLACDPNSAELKELKQKYGVLAPLLLNDRGISKVDFFQHN